MPADQQKSYTPLGIIAIFVTFAETTLGVVVTRTTGGIQMALTSFVCLFPLIIASGFFYLLYDRPENFYAPKDFGADASYLESMKSARRERVKMYNSVADDLERNIEQEVRKASHASSANILGQVGAENITQTAQRVAQTVRSASFITIDPRALNAKLDSVQLPVAAYEDFSAFTDDVYSILSDKIDAYTYGYEWVLRDGSSKKVIKNKRMIDNIRAGIPYPDDRKLEEVNIFPGMTLEVVRPKDKENL